MRKIIKAVAGLVAVFVVSWWLTEGVLGYSQPWVRRMADGYGKLVASFVPIKILSYGARGDTVKPGGDEPPVYLGKRLRVMAITPEVRGYEEVLARILRDGIQVVVESSGIDAWHTTYGGQKALNDMRGRCLRVVVFDGGHHLPTLALQPDLIIIPDTCGYAAHSYMRDAISIAALCEIIKKENLDIPMVVVPRWGLVKTASSMCLLTTRALSSFSCAAHEARKIRGQVLGYRCTKYDRAVFFYLSSPQECDAQRIAERLTPDVERVYLAVNYGTVTADQAERLADSLTGRGFRSAVVNTPLNVKRVLVKEVERVLSSYCLRLKRL